MRSAAWVVLGSFVPFSAGLLAHASDWPAIVVPGKPGVPVIINGFDASYSIVEGDYGLDRPGAVPLTIITPPLAPVPRYSSYYGISYPSEYTRFNGRRPGYGRLERVPPPNRRKPPPAESYRRFWSAGSDPLPATIDPPGNTEINVVPFVDDRGRRRPHRTR